jgi:F-type H+-transporting ATPase subunit alpha
MNAPPETLQCAVDGIFAGLRQARREYSPRLAPREVGVITNVSTGIATISGLPGVGFEELVRFPGGLLGIAFNVDEDEVGVILLGDYEDLHTGDEVERTGRVMDVAVGDALLGRVIDPLGRPLDGGGPVATDARLPVERPAPAIMDRLPVTVPLQTGLKVVDALIPIGLGQRELILGDRQTGKTAIAVDAILNQRGKNVVCVYCAIGQRASSVAKVVANLREKGAMEFTIVVVAEGDDAPGLAYVTPYAATSIAEHFMEAGRDVLIVYDDLTHHARSYRELSLLLRRPPGREAFPGDIFYIHSRLLERATHLCKERGGGSLTALPIIETDAQDISAYIPTNLISITDGQIYLSPTLFELGILPAVDVGKSVSRVGGEAQRPAYRSVAGDLKLAYSQFEELEAFARFGTRLDESTRRTIEHGRRIRACLKQPESQPVSMLEQITVLLALTAGLFDNVPLDKTADAERALQQAIPGISQDLAGRLVSSDKLDDADRKTVLEIATKALASFQPVPDPKAAAQPAVDAKTDKKPAADAKGDATPAPTPKPGEKPAPDPKAAAQSAVDAKPDEKPEAVAKAAATSAPTPKPGEKPAPDPKAAAQPASDAKPDENPVTEVKAAAVPAPAPEADAKPPGKPAP